MTSQHLAHLQNDPRGRGSFWGWRWPLYGL